MSNHFAVICLRMEFTFNEHYLEGTQGSMKNFFSDVAHLSSLELKAVSKFLTQRIRITDPEVEVLSLKVNWNRFAYCAFIPPCVLIHTKPRGGPVTPDVTYMVICF